MTKSLLCNPVTVEELANLSPRAKRWLEYEFGLKIITTPTSIYVERKENSDD